MTYALVFQFSNSDVTFWHDCCFFVFLDAIRTANREMGGLNVLCNNAGFGRPFYDTSRWEEEIDVNLVRKSTTFH